MSIEIEHTRRLPDGRFRCVVTFPCSATYAKGTNDLLSIEPRAYSAAEQYDLRRACASHAVQKPIPRELTPEQLEALRSQLDREAAERALTGYANHKPVPRASFPPYVTAQDEPPLRACDDPDNRVGGTD